MLVTGRDIAWVTAKLDASAQAAYKRLYLGLSSDPCGSNHDTYRTVHGTSDGSASTHAVPQRPAVASNDDPLCLTQNTTWTLRKALRAMRVIALDERTLWECMGVRFYHTADQFIDSWNEQLSVKLVHQFLEQRGAPSESAALMGELIEHTRVYITPRHVANVAVMSLSTSGSLPRRDESVCADGSRRRDHGADPPLCASESEWNDTCRDGEERDGATSTMTCDAARPSEQRRGRDGRACPSVSLRCGAVGVLPKCGADAYSEGALVCTRPVPPFAELLRVPRAVMFFRDTVLQHCELAHALTHVAALQSVVETEEVLLVLCLIYEMRLVGPDASHWSVLLSACPASYPSIPAFWRASDLAELDGTDVLDDVLAKRQQVEEFCTEVMPVLELVYPELPASVRAQHSLPKLQQMYSSDSVLWARATFDSRAFNLNVDGRTVLALVPWADMINHHCRSDVLVRKVLSLADSGNSDGTEQQQQKQQQQQQQQQSSSSSPVCDTHLPRTSAVVTEDAGETAGDFVMYVGAALTEADGDVGRELWMSYGPLQNWELLQFYGFVLSENEHDKLPFPFQPLSTAVHRRSENSHSGEDDAHGSEDAQSDEEEAGAVETDANAQLRACILAHYGLFTLQRSWIAHTGVPCEALRALLRVYLADASQLKGMYHPQWFSNVGVDVHTTCIYVTRDIALPEFAPSRTPFDALSPETEREIVRTVEMTVQCVLDQFGTTLAQDEQRMREMEEQLRGDGGDDENKNTILCLRLRVALKRIAHRTIAWCAARAL